MLIARRMTYASSPLKGVDLRDESGKLVASCYGHGSEGEQVLQSLLDTFPGDDVIVSYIRPRSIVRVTPLRVVRENLPAPLDALIFDEHGDYKGMRELPPPPAPPEPDRLLDKLTRLGKALVGALAT